MKNFNFLLTDEDFADLETNARRFGVKKVDIVRAGTLPLLDALERGEPLVLPADDADDENPALGVRYNFRMEDADFVRLYALAKRLGVTASAVARAGVTSALASLRAGAPLVIRQRTLHDAAVSGK